MSSKKADSTKEMTFASFFHSDTEGDLIDQVEWVEEKLGLSDSFFSRMLQIEEDLFLDWRTGEGTISSDKQACLREFWQAITHILSFLNYDLDSVLSMLEHTNNDKIGAIRSVFTPPWAGESMKAYLEAHGLEGVRKVSEWLQSVRFADSY